MIDAADGGTHRQSSLGVACDARRLTVCFEDAPGEIFERVQSQAGDAVRHARKQLRGNCFGHSA
jgi:hypothetical protein